MNKLIVVLLALLFFVGNKADAMPKPNLVTVDQDTTILIGYRGFMLTRKDGKNVLIKSKFSRPFRFGTKTKIHLKNSEKIKGFITGINSSGIRIRPAALGEKPGEEIEIEYSKI